jgi:MFS family permease
MLKVGLKVVLAAAAFATFIYSWDTNMMQPVLPFFVGQNAGLLGIDPKGVSGFLGMVMGIYALVNCGGNLLFGWLSDIRGRRIMLTIGFLGCAVALMFYERASTAQNLILVRSIHGFFSGALGPCTAAILADMAPPDKRGSRMAMWAIFVSIGTIVASPVAGNLSTYFGPASVWNLMAAGYFITTIVVWLLIPDTRKIYSTESAAIGSNTPATTQADIKPKVSRWGFLGRVNIWIACIGIMALFWVMAAWVSVFTLYLTDLNKVGILPVKPTLAFGYLMGLYGLSVIVAGGQFGMICDAMGRKRLLIPAFGLLTLAPILVSLNNVWLLVVGWGVCFGLAGAMIWPAVMAVMTDELKPQERGTGMGVFMVFPTLGIGIGSMLIGQLGNIMTYQSALWIAAILPLIAFVLSFFAKRRMECKEVGRRLKGALAGGLLFYLLMTLVLGLYLTGTIGS